MARVLIPELYCEDRKCSTLTQDEQRQFYEKGLLPAVANLQGDAVAEWPPDYNCEMFHARGHNGQLAFQSKTIPAWNVKRLGQTIRQSLQSREGLVFLLQIRGVKHSTTHNADNYGDAYTALHEFLQESQLVYDEMVNEGAWYIDVAIEISSAIKNCLAWRTGSHRTLVHQACGLEEHTAIRMTRVSSSQYMRDMASHLPGVSGCRIKFGSQARGPYEIRYCQAYTTDKSLTAWPEGFHHAKYITCRDALSGKVDKFLENLYNVYVQGSYTSYALARFEVRVPLECADAVLIDIEPEIIRGCLVSIPKDVWWGLRACRTLGLKYLLEWQAAAEPKFRVQKSSLLLTAAAVWLINSLHATPDTGASSKELMDLVLPHVETQGADPDILAYKKTGDGESDADDIDTDSDEEGVPRVRRRRTAETSAAWPYGLVFLVPIRMGDQYPCPRFSSGHILSDKRFKYFFGADFDDVATQCLSSSVVASKHPSRVANKRQSTVPYVRDREEEYAQDFESIARLGLEMPPPARDGGSDNEMSDDDDDVYDSDEDLPAILTRRHRQGS
ncbi:hypothetical protein C0993_010714 [Termitomyces sp. T159_Od127]|nr:hypothetical protein C0993_010714 [Termitomyces sp. T159_Od127]